MLNIMLAFFLGALTIFAQNAAPASGVFFTAERVNNLGRGRYTAALSFETATWEVFGSQPRFDPENPGMLSGYQASTAAALGISEGWNEIGNDVAARVVLRSDEPVLFMGDQYYLMNCKWFMGGKWVPFNNRFRPIVPPTASAPPSPPTSAPSSIPVDAAKVYPRCEILGNPKDGFTFQLAGGEGLLALDGGAPTAVPSKLGVTADIKPGSHKVTLKVMAPDGEVALCEYPFVVYAPVAAEVTEAPTITLPADEPKKTGRPLWSKFPVANCGWTFGSEIRKWKGGPLAEKTVCGAVGVLGGLWGAGAFRAAAAVLVPKPNARVLSP